MNQNNEKNQKKTKYFDENKMIHDFSPEKNIQVIKPIPVELSFKQSNDNFLLNKKEKEVKVFLSIITYIKITVEMYLHQFSNHLIIIMIKK